MIVSFGDVPIGARFTRRVKQRQMADRRRFEFVDRPFKKTRHGTIAGWALELPPFTTSNDREMRFDHYDRVTIDDDDLRLIVTCLQSQERRKHGQQT